MFIRTTYRVFIFYSLTEVSIPFYSYVGVIISSHQFLTADLPAVILFYAFSLFLISVLSFNSDCLYINPRAFLMLLRFLVVTLPAQYSLAIYYNLFQPHLFLICLGFDQFPVARSSFSSQDTMPVAFLA